MAEEEPREVEEEKSPTTQLIDIAEKAAKRMEDANRETARLFKLQEERDARIALGGELGGRAELVLVSEEDAKKKRASEFFKDTALEGAIKKL